MTDKARNDAHAQSTIKHTKIMKIELKEITIQELANATKTIQNMALWVMMEH